MNVKLLYEELALLENRQNNERISKAIEDIKLTLDMLLTSYSNTAFLDETKAQLKAVNVVSELMTINTQIKNMINNLGDVNE